MNEWYVLNNSHDNPFSNTQLHSIQISLFISLRKYRSVILITLFFKRVWLRWHKNLIGMYRVNFLFLIPENGDAKNYLCSISQHVQVMRDVMRQKDEENILSEDGEKLYNQQFSLNWSFKIMIERSITLLSIHRKLIFIFFCNLASSKTWWNFMQALVILVPHTIVIYIW